MHILTNGRQAVRVDRQLDKRIDGQTGIFEKIRYSRIQISSFSVNGKAKESTKQYDLFTKIPDD